MTVVVAIDNSDPARKALKYAFETYPDEEILVLHALSPPESMAAGEARMYVDWDELMERQRERTEDLFEEAEELAAVHGARITTETAVGRPDRAIVDYVESNDVEHVVVGSHGRRGVSRVLLGSVAETVVRRAPVPVTVVR